MISDPHSEVHEQQNGCVEVTKSPPARAVYGSGMHRIDAKRRGWTTESKAPDRTPELTQGLKSTTTHADNQILCMSPDSTKPHLVSRRVVRKCSWEPDLISKIALQLLVISALQRCIRKRLVTCPTVTCDWKRIFVNRHRPRHKPRHKSKSPL